MATKAPAFQFYAQDFLVGTQGMSAAARGCYVSMLASSWVNGPIMDTPRSIAAAMGLTPFDPPFAAMWEEVQPKWTLGADGWTNAKLESVRAEQEAYRSRQADKGRKSAANRSHSTETQPETNHGSTTVQPAFQPAGQPDTQPDGNPSPLTFGLDLRSTVSPSTDTEVQTKNEVQREKPRVPKLLDFDSVAQHLKAAAYAHIAEHPDCEDGELAEAVKDAAAKLHVYDYTGRKVTAIVNSVRGYLASVSA